MPIPKNAETRKGIACETRRVIETRIQLRNRAKEIALEVEGIEHPRNGDLEAIEDVQNEN